MEPTKAKLSKGAWTRQRILDTALGIFGETGFNRASLRDIAASVGITHVGLLHHFPTKEDLLLKALERKDELDIATIGNLQLEGRAFIVGTLRIVDRNTTTPGTVTMFTRLSAEAVEPDHPAHEYFRVRYERLRAAVTRAFDAEFKQLEDCPPISASTAAKNLIAMVDGLQIQWGFDPASTDMVGLLLEYLNSLGMEISRDEATYRGQPEDEPA